MENTKYILDRTLIVIAIIAVLFFFNKKTSDVKYESRDTIVNIYYGDTNLYTIKITNPQPIVTVDLDIPSNIDTNSIIRDYFRKKSYDTTFVDDSNVFIRGYVDVSKNNLDAFNLDYKVRKPTSIITTIIKEEFKYRLYGGLSIGLNSLEPNVNLLYKNHSFGAGYELLENKGIRAKYAYLLLSK